MTSGYFSSTEHSIIKSFTSKIKWKKELFIYSQELSWTPKMFDYNPKNLTISIEKLSALPYLNIDSWADNIDELANVISMLHSTTRSHNKVFCHWDNQPANILFDQVTHQFYLIDFADSRMSYPENDLIHLMLFWAEKYPPRHFSKLAESFISSYKNYSGLSQAKWSTAFRTTVSRFIQRRIKYNKNTNQNNPYWIKNLRIIQKDISKLISVDKI